MKKIVLEKTTNQGDFRVIEKQYFNSVYYEIQRRCKIIFFTYWSTLNDNDLECPFTYKWKSMDDVNDFFKTGKIRYPGTCLP